LDIETGTVTLSCDGGTETIRITSKLNWEYSLSYPDGQSAQPFAVIRNSENELHISASERKHDGSVRFDNYYAVLEVYCEDHPEIRKEIQLIQSYQSPSFILSPGVPENSEDYTKICTGIENGFDVPQSQVMTYIFAIDANYPFSVLNDCNWIETSLVKNDDNTHILTVTAKPEPGSKGSTAEIRIGNTLYFDGDEKETYNIIAFRHGEYINNISLEHNSNTITKPEYTLSLNYNDLHENFGISSNCSWTIKSDTEWIRTSISGSASSAVTELEGSPEIRGFNLHIEPNFDKDARTGEISLKDNDNTISYRITITQSAFDGIEYTTTDNSRLMIAENGYSAHKFDNGVGRLILKPESETEITAGAFNNCSKLKTIRLQSTLKTVGASAFSRCAALEKVVFTNESFREGDGIMGSAFYECTSLKEMDIPGGSKNGSQIFPSVFEGCQSLTKVHWGDNLIAVRERAFYNCLSLTALTDMDNDCSIAVEDYAFYSCSRLQKIDVTSVGNFAFSGCSFLLEVNMHDDDDSDNSQSIGDYAFYNCSRLSGITFPANLRNIGDNAFSQSGLKEVLFNRNLQKIGEWAFFNCENLTKVENPLDGLLTYVGNGAFRDCQNLKSVRLCNGFQVVKSTFGHNVFSGTRLKSLYLNFVGPPALTATIFGNGATGLNPLDNPNFKIYVDEFYFPEYITAEFWKDYPITGIPGSEMSVPL